MASFADSPPGERIEKLINRWQKPEPPDLLADVLAGKVDFPGMSRAISDKMAASKSLRTRKQLEVAAISWLYDFIRKNVIRGREFDLRRVLKTGVADCLGYSKLFTVLGRWCGLDAGIVEVVKDTGGRLEPHTAIMVKLADGGLSFIDFWYGSQDIKHKRLGLQVKRNGKWQTEDLNFKELKSLEVRPLPDSCVDGITSYITGNRHLKNGEYDSAVKSYSKALKLYPDNPAFLYNRAIAYVKLDEMEKAKADYTQALRNENSVMRVLATEHEEVTALMKLDGGIINSKAQEIYLLHKGFTTGRQVDIIDIARRFGLSETEARAIIYMVEEQLGRK